jgi:hypothetical protein
MRAEIEFVRGLSGICHWFVIGLYNSCREKYFDGRNAGNEMAFWWGQNAILNYG